MGKSDFCCVNNCSRQRDRVKDKGEACSFYQIPLGKTSKATTRRKLWLMALRRPDFTPTKNSKVCNLHFVSGMANNDPTSEDYVPTLHLGYAKQTKRRTSSLRKRARWTDEKLKQNKKTQLGGLAVPKGTGFIQVSACNQQENIPCKPSDLYDRSHPDWAPTLKLTDTATPSETERRRKQAETDLKRYKRAKERSRTKNKHHGARALLDLNNDQEPELLTTPIHDTTLHAQPFPIEMTTFCFNHVKALHVNALKELAKRQLTLRQTNQTQADVKQMLTVKKEVSPENWSPSLDLEDQKPPQIKEEQEESEIIQFKFSPAPVKSEDDEEKPQLSPFYFSQTESNRDSVEPDQGLKPDPGLSVGLCPADVQQLVVVKVDENKVFPENCNLRLDHKDQKPPQIKEEKEESDIMQFTFSPVPVKSENDECEPHSSELHLNQTEEDRDSVEPDRSDPKGKTLDSSETDITDGSCRESPKCQSQDMQINHFSCCVCGQTFSSKDSLSSHTKVHTEEKPFGCSVCTKAFRKKGDLVKHMRVHTGERPCKCAFCNAAFKSNRSLAEHTRIHTGEQPYCCTICGLGYRQKSCLTGHMRLHTGERPFSCSNCKETFRWRNCLRLHKKTKCEKRPFRCSVCEAPFGREKALVQHMKIHAGVV